MKKIVFRADAGLKLGTGDLISLINLSRYFERAGWETHFIVKDYEPAIDIIKSRSIERCSIIKKDISIREEVAGINSYIADKEIDVIFFEITERRLTEYTGISAGVLQACVNFDGVIHEKMELVVNWDTGADKIYDMKKYPGTRFLLGTAYAALPIEFDFGKIGRRAYASKARKLLIMMGGADELNFTQEVVKTLIKNRIGLKLNIVIGSGYLFRSELEKRLKSSPLDYKIEQNVVDVFGAFMDCDMAVSAGGFTAFELIATKTPSFLIAACEHQIPRCEYFDKMGWAKYLGFRDFDEDAMIEGIKGPVRIPPGQSFDIERIVSSTDEILKRRQA